MHVAQRHVIKPRIEHVPPQVRLARFAARPGRETGSDAMGDDDVSQRRMVQQSRRVGVDQRAVRHAVDQDSQLLE